MRADASASRSNAADEATDWGGTSAAPRAGTVPTGAPLVQSSSNSTPHGALKFHSKRIGPLRGAAISTNSCAVQSSVSTEQEIRSQVHSDVLPSSRQKESDWLLGCEQIPAF